MAGKKTVKKGEWVDPDDAPHLDRDWFERAEIWRGGKANPARQAEGRGAEESEAP